MRKRWVMLCSVLGLIIGLSGCATKEVAPPPPKPKPKPVVKQKPKPKPMDMSYGWQGFPQPAPTPESSKILIEKRVPRKIKPGQQFSFTIDIKNNADFTITELNLSERLPAGFKMSGCSLSPRKKGNSLEWNLGDFRPGQKKQIKVTGTVSIPGAARFFGNTDLDFDMGETSSVVEVIMPKLDFGLSKPGTAIVQEPIPVKLMFKNDGQAPVIGVKLINTLPKGLLTAEGKSKIDLEVGNLKPHQSKVVDLKLKAEKTGNFKINMVAVAGEGISARASTSVKVTEAKLEISGKAPRKRFVGKIIPYEINVKNVGDAITKKVVVRMDLPEGASPTSAGEDGKVRGRNLIWNIKSLHPGESKKLVAKVVANKIMMARVVASAESGHSKPVQVAMVTDIAGIAAVLGTLIDKNDPVPVGEDEVYELIVTNQGSLPATKIKVSCFLEDSMEYVKSSGASKGTMNGSKLTFAPLAALPPQAKAVWRITVKAVKQGDVRFKVQIKSDQLHRPVELSESTHFYE